MNALFNLQFNIQPLLFFSFALVAIFSASQVILSRHAVRSVLFLILCFVATSGIWLLLEAEFLALTLVVVYVGAVMVLFLFVVMMLDVDLLTRKDSFARYWPFGFAVAVLFMVEIAWVFAQGQMGGLQSFPEHEANYSNIHALGELMYTEYLYPVELAGLLLLVAMVAAISLTFRGIKTRKQQNPSLQVRVSKKERLRVMKMEPAQRPLEEEKT